MKSWLARRAAPQPRHRQVAAVVVISVVAILAAVAVVVETPLSCPKVATKERTKQVELSEKKEAGSDSLKPVPIADPVIRIETGRDPLRPAPVAHPVIQI